MSFDLKLVNGDLEIGSDGSLELVFNEQKLAQEVLKAIFTPTGSNKSHLWYGSQLQSRSIGQPLDGELTQSVVENSVLYAVKNLQMLQQRQEADGQLMMPRERIKSIQGVSVYADDYDKRKLNIIVSLLTRSNTILQENFVINI